MPARKKQMSREEERLAPIDMHPPIPDVPKRLLAAALKDRLERGVYEPGTAVPSLEEMVKMTGVARGTVRAGIKILAEQGYVKSVIGAATYVLPREYWPGGKKHQDYLDGKL